MNPLATVKFSLIILSIFFILQTDVLNENFRKPKILSTNKDEQKMFLFKYFSGQVKIYKNFAFCFTLKKVSTI